MNKNIKLGHQAPRNWRINKFNSIELEGDVAYCTSHDFVYNPEIEEQKLYNAQPCYYTDKRFIDGKFNFFKETKIHWTRFKDVSLKTCIRKTLNCKNIPVGTIVKFAKSWYYKGKNIDNSFLFKIKKENKLDIKYEISEPSFFNNFETHSFSKKLTNKLRENGFIVQVFNINPNYISSLISTAGEYLNKNIEITNEEGEYAIAYGYNKKIGFSSHKNSFRGYSNGCNNILWDKFGEFNKWSQCNEINKDLEINEIIKILKEK